jgi:hypothetical protein
MEEIIFWKKNELLKVADEEYFARPELNFSSFKNFLISGKYYETKIKEEEKEPSDSLLFGSIFHASILDQSALNKFLPYDSINRRTKEGKEEWEKLQTEAQENKKVLVSREIYDAATSIELTPVVGNILESDFNKYEQTILWDFESLHCKSKIDLFNPYTQTLVDVKTTKDLPGFEKVINMNKYYLQLAFYQLALEACGYVVNNWKIIAVENTAPYDNTVFNFEYDYINFAVDYLKTQLKRFEFQQNFAGFKGLSEDKEINISLPRYLF